MVLSLDNEQGLEQLKIQLTKMDWPSVYMFKFIFKSSNRTYALVHQLFTDEFRFSDKPSAKGKYTSVTVKELMISADEVIERYRKALEIEGVIAL
jgi:uncharacterized protein